MMKGYQKGFTLIELLVVIAIIAILAGILFPVFSRVRENGRKTNCQSNLHQLAVAVSSYTQDYDSFLPGSWDGTGNTPGTVGSGSGGWMYFTNFLSPTQFYPEWGALYAYVKNKQIYQCPSDFAKLGNSYAISSRICATPTGAYHTLHYGRSLAAIHDASATFLFLEEGGMAGAQWDTTDDGYLNIDYGNVVCKRHFDGSNIAFVDGHVKFLKATSIIYPNPNGIYHYEP